MLLSTTDTITGKKIIKQLGLAKGNTIRARHIGRDIMAIRMIEDAQKLGANAIVHMGFSTQMVMGGASEILAYGTAVVVE